MLAVGADAEPVTMRPKRGKVMCLERDLVVNQKHRVYQNDNVHFSLDFVGQDTVGCKCTGFVVWSHSSLISHPHRQPTARTIENALFDAMVKVGAVSQDNADDPVKVWFLK